MTGGAAIGAQLDIVTLGVPPQVIALGECQEALADAARRPTPRIPGRFGQALIRPRPEPRRRPLYFANASPTLRATVDGSAEVMFDIAATTIPRSRTVTTDTTLTPGNSPSKMTLTPSNSPS